jgi:hypothetical protein
VLKPPSWIQSNSETYDHNKRAWIKINRNRIKKRIDRSNLQATRRSKPNLERPKKGSERSFGEAFKIRKVNWWNKGGIKIIVKMRLQNGVNIVSNRWVKSGIKDWLKKIKGAMG